MGVTKLNRKQLSEQLRHSDTSKVRVAISRGNIKETKNGFIDVSDEDNHRWIESQIRLARQRGVVVDMIVTKKPDMDLDAKRDEAAPGKSNGSVDIELKKARTELVREQTKTAQLNREIAFGNYLRTADVVEAVQLYLDQTMNIANTNISNAVTRIALRHTIKSAEDVIKIKSELTDALNEALENGRKEVEKVIERMILEQVEKLAKK